MASTIYAQSKLQYYPTHMKEVYRLLPFVCNIYINPYKKKELIKYIQENISDTEYKQFQENTLDRCLLPELAYYEFILNHNMYEYINYFEFTIRDKQIKTTNQNNAYSYNQDSTNKDNTVVIHDLFAGEAEFLQTFSIIKNSVYLVANEIEENRYNKIVDNQICNEITNYSFEEYPYIPQSTSLALFNPPYNDDGAGERSIRRYLKMYIDRDILYRNKQCNGKMIFVIRQDDALDIIDLLAQYFNVLLHSCYKSHSEEFSKYKQLIFMAEIRTIPYDKNNTNDIFEIQNQSQILKDLFSNPIEYDISKSQDKTIYWAYLPSIPYQQIKEDYKFNSADNKIKYLSTKDDSYNWLKEITQVKNMATENLTIPKPLKSGELALLISSGYLNSTLSKEDNTAKHIVVGGTKPMEKEESYKEKNEAGENITVTKRIKYSQPYLNILYVDSEGKMQIKELKTEQNVEESEDNNTNNSESEMK